MICRSMLKPNSGGGESVDYICEYENSLPDGALNRDHVYPVSIEASVSAATARIIATMDGGVFPALREDAWSDLLLMDESGTEYRVGDGSDGNDKQTSISFDGTGKLPDSLILYTLLVSGGEWDKEAAMATTALFVLKPVEND